jgi:cytochrome c-type biogenesis protein CcmH
MRMIILLGIALTLVGRTAHADAPTSPFAEAAVPLEEPPALSVPDSETATARTRTVARGLRCPVCQGLSVADSNADSARAMHDRIAELVDQGYSEQQISDYFVDRYGAWVRLEPEPEGMALLIFVLPAGMLVFGGLWLAARGRNSDLLEESPPGPSRTQVQEDSEYRQRILAELGES